MGEKNKLKKFEKKTLMMQSILPRHVCKCTHLVNLTEGKQQRQQQQGGARRGMTLSSNAAHMRLSPPM